MDGSATVAGRGMEADLLALHYAPHRKGGRNVKRVLRIVGGFTLIAVGLVLALPGVPGPGIALILLGLLLLSDHFDWAERLLRWLRTRVDRLRGARTPNA